MVNVFKSLREQIRSSFFTADATRAEHRDLFVLVGIEMGGDIFRKFSEGVGVRIDRAFEGTDFDFVLVAGVDDEYVGIGDELVPILGFDVGTDGCGRIDGGDAEGDDFLFESDFKPVEWRFFSDRFFVF